MMRWPWQRAEVRASQPFTDAIISAIGAAASGTTATASATAALEAAAGAVARGFQVAKVEPAHPAITPAVLALIGRDLIRRGESVFHIEVEAGAPVLRPAGSWDVRGGYREADWRYRLDLFGPSGNVTRFVPAAAVLHFRYAVDPARPWLGLGPLQWAALSGTLHAGAVAALSRDMNAASATVIPMPPTADDGDQLDNLKTAVSGAKGKSVFTETTRAALGGDHRDAPANDWMQRRLGPSPDETLATMVDTTAVQILAACGVPADLAGLVRTDGSALRESYRRFERMTLQPLARIVEAELCRKLDAPRLALGFNSLRSSDFAGIARALKALVEAGIPLPVASELLDLEVVP